MERIDRGDEAKPGGHGVAERVAFARFVLTASALAFAAIGAAFLIAPTTLASHVGVSLAGPLADNDVRAVYGGLQLACAVFLLLCTLDAQRLRLGLVAQLCLFGGLLSGRLVSGLAVGWPGGLGLALGLAELLAVALGCVAANRLSDRR